MVCGTCAEGEEVRALLEGGGGKVMGWNYRVIHHYDGGDWWAIHEVYYNKRGGICAISKDPMNPQGETSQELYDDYVMMRDAFHKDALQYDSIEYEDWDTPEEVNLS